MPKFLLPNGNQSVRAMVAGTYTAPSHITLDSSWIDKTVVGVEDNSGRRLRNKTYTKGMYDVTAQIKKSRKLERRLRAEAKREKAMAATKKRREERRQAKEEELRIKKEASNARKYFIKNGLEKMPVPADPIISMYATPEYKEETLTNHKRVVGLIHHYNRYIDILNDMHANMSMKERKKIYGSYYDDREDKHEIWKRIIANDFANKTPDEQYETVLWSSYGILEDLNDASPYKKLTEILQYGTN